MQIKKQTRQHMRRVCFCVLVWFAGVSGFSVPFTEPFDDGHGKLLNDLFAACVVFAHGVSVKRFLQKVRGRNMQSVAQGDDRFEACLAGAALDMSQKAQRDIGHFSQRRLRDVSFFALGSYAYSKCFVVHYNQPFFCPDVLFLRGLHLY